MKKGILLLGLAALAVLAFFCIRSHVPWIENDIRSRAESALKSENLAFASLHADGRDLRLEGAAPDPGALEKALRVAGGIWGVRRVESRLEIAKAPPAPPAPPSPPAALAPDRWLFAMLRDPAGIKLEGMLPDEKTRDLFLQSAGRHLSGAPLDHRIELNSGAPEAWRKTLDSLLRFMDEFARVTAELTAGGLSISGHMQSEKTRAQFTQDLEGRLPADLARTVTISIPELTQAALTCQQELDAVLATTRILFDVDSVVIQPDSARLLQDLAAAAGSCPKVRIKIAGHTDSSGSEESNLKLSQGRAQAVAGRLAELGVASDRVTTAGYGETRPVADNATADGRALNRRIEFIITEEKP